jgi:hypothetical protein
MPFAFAKCDPAEPRETIARRAEKLRFSGGFLYARNVHVLIAVGDVGSGVQLEEALNGAGFEATWDAAQHGGPVGNTLCDVVLVDADQLGASLAAIADAWRDQPSAPGVVAVGSSAAAREHAPAARVTLLSPAAKVATLAQAIKDAAKLRLAAGMRWSVMRAALKLPPVENEPAAWPAAVLHARNVDLDVARAALRWHVQHYATPTPMLAQLRDERVLTVPELATLDHVDGTQTVQRLVKTGPLDPTQSARLFWAMTSMGALALTPEVYDVATPSRRALDEIRRHLRARVARLEKSTYYDVLEITPLAEYDEIEAAYRMVGSRFSPQALARYDLAELVSHVQPTWDVVEKARAVLVDHAQRGRYTDWLRKNLASLKTTWAIDVNDSKAAAEAFTRGQRALGEGDAHKAMGELARACRFHSGHPDYEANLAWARFRVQVASGRPAQEVAKIERELVESVVLGRRPWPRALVALALLCAAGGDADSARWHLAIALSIDPNVPAAAQLAQRLGLRR